MRIKNMSKQLIEIKEHGESSEKLNLTKDDLEYIESKKFNPNHKKDIEVTREGVIRNNGPWAGIIKLNDGKELNFCTKMKANIFYMLSYLDNFESFRYDHERLIELEDGKLFFDVIARMMISEFEQVCKKGLLKKYVRKKENLNYLRGKILIKEQIKKNKIDKSKFFCEYDDLTYDNLENRSILYAINLLINCVHNKKLKFKLNHIQNQISEEVEFKFVRPIELENVSYNLINNYYEKILKLAYHIIKSSYAQGTASNKGLGFNFLVDMNKVYESFITSILREIIIEDYPHLELVSQVNLKSLVKEGKKFTTKPDIIIKKNNEIKLIIDVKYKVNKIPNGDFYQVLCYLLAIPSAEKAVLLYEKVSDKEGSFSRVHKNIEEDDAPLIVNFEEADLSSILNEKFNSLDDFKIKIKKHLKKKKIIKDISMI
jgi:5-methylcytosine-specific restriction endonuclease McrBC regulatory subunit McrC